MNENERIVCEFLRKIAPPREWKYLGEVEHYWINELCDELNKQLKVENAKLREALAYAFDMECAASPTECETCKERCPFNRIGVLMDELGIEVGE